MKKLLAILLALTMLTMLAACGGTKPEEAVETPGGEETMAGSDALLPEEEYGIESEYAEEEPEAEPETPSHPEDEAILNAEGTVYEPVSGTLGVGAYAPGEGVFDVSFVGAEFYRSAEDAECVRIWYDVTNTALKPLEAMEVDVSAVQDGDYLWSISSDETDTPEVHVRYVNLRPGVTVRCAKEFECDWDGGVIYVAASYYVTWDGGPLDALVNEGAESIETGLFDDSLIAAFDPAALPARPAADDPTVPIDDPDWLHDVPDEGSLEYGAAYAAIKGSEVFVDGDKEIIRIFVTYTNTDASVMTASYMDVRPLCRAMQDGIELEAYKDDITVPEDDNRTAQLDYEESIDIAVEYVLRSSSPVAFEYYIWTTDAAEVGAVLDGRTE